MSYPNPPQPLKATIVRHLLAPSQDPQRIGQFDFVAIYAVNNGQQFTVIIPKRDPTEAEVDLAIKADYEKQKRFINREVNL